jgi:hypothetical protein
MKKIVIMYRTHVRIFLKLIMRSQLRLNGGVVQIVTLFELLYSL